MAWRIADYLERGEIDNTTKGRITGRIWFAGKSEPVELDLQGNGHPDLAGCRLTFTNPRPEPWTERDMVPLQQGTVGDMTASRKVRILDVPVEEAYRLSKEGKPVPEHKGNCLYLEWFSQANGRVVIESTDYQVEVSSPHWRLTREEYESQHESTQEAMRNWVDMLTDGEFEEEDQGEEDFEDEDPMDEFQWERFLKESDARTDKYMELVEKYRDHPDSEKLIAREMGWTWLEEALEAQERGAYDDLHDDEDDDDFEPLEPNPATEGVDWVRDEDGRIHHPLTRKAMRVAMSMWHQCDELGLMGEEGDEKIRNMVFAAQTLSAKLAGALDHLAYESVREPGFVVACLKRSLTYLNESVALSEEVLKEGKLPEGMLTSFRENLFGVRERILELMSRFRQNQDEEY